jgi:hypothetical protein
MARRAKGWTCQKQANGTKCKQWNVPRTRKCGACGKPRPLKRSKTSSMIGQKFGRLTVITRGDSKSRSSWICRCSCGNETEILQQSLIAGLTQSCGCYQIEQARKATLKDLSGQRFGRWSVRCLADGIRAQNGGVYYVCVCECGHIQEIASSTLIQGQSRGCSKCAANDRRKQYCIKGHNTEMWGRNDSGACKACIKERNLHREYGITLDEYVALWEAQGGVCAICGKDLDLGLGEPGWNKGSRVEVDHSHHAGLERRDSVRGLLCGGRWSGCNRRLGHVDDASWLEAARDYITNPPAQKYLKRSDSNMV